MANRGETKGCKRISSSKVRNIQRKENVWTVKTRPGKHSAITSVPLAVAVRDVIGLIGNLREAKHIINNGMVKVDGIVRKDYRFSVGLFDVLDIETSKKRYRAIYDQKGRLEFKELDAKGKLEKLAKIIGKNVRKGNRIQLKLNDGSIIVNPKGTFKVGDSIKISLPDCKILEHFEEKEGQLIYLIGGTRVGTFARLQKIAEGTLQKQKLVNLEQEKTEFQTVEKNVFVVGSGDKPAVDMGELNG